MIGISSRYLHSKIDKLGTTRGIVRTIVSGSQREFHINYLTHVFLSSERIDLIARHFYGKDTLWWIIADANPEIMDWSSIKPGTLIRIPQS